MTSKDHTIAIMEYKINKARGEIGQAQTAILLNDIVEIRKHVNAALDILNGKEPKHDK